METNVCFSGRLLNKEQMELRFEGDYQGDHSINLSIERMEKLMKYEKVAGEAI